MWLTSAQCPNRGFWACFEWFPRHFDSILGVERYRELELEAWLAGECSTPRSMVVAEAFSASGLRCFVMFRAFEAGKTSCFGA